MKNNKKILVVILVLGILLLAFDYYQYKSGFNGILKRNGAGKGKAYEELQVEYLNQKEDISIEVSEKSLSDKELENAFDEAIKEIDESYLGDNLSANNVSRDLVLKKVYANGLISAEWSFDKNGYIDSDGKLNQDKIPEEGELVNVTVLLRYEENEQLYSFCVVVMPLGLETIDGQLMAIEHAVKDKDANTREKEELVLPTNVKDMDVHWKRRMNYRGLQIIILGFVCVAGVSIGKKRDEKKAKEIMLQEMDMDYPLIVGQLSILMGAGMSFRKALERIVTKYSTKVKEGKAKQKAGFDQILYVYRRMSDGLSEIQAIEELGMRCESRNYRKLAMLLSQNLRKGSRELLDCLEKEQQNAYELRKQTAIRKGEEASTKLLMPMAGMLFIVILILVVPAIMQMKM